MLYNEYMQKKTIVLLILGLIVVAGAGWAYSNWKAYAPTTYVQETTNSQGVTSSTTVNTATGTTTPGAPSYTLAQIATHNNASSCYSAINSKVYDLTLWINVHPGGKDKILSICGTDGSAQFNAQHSGQRKPMTALARFLVGTLTK